MPAGTLTARVSPTARMMIVPLGKIYCTLSMSLVLPEGVSLTVPPLRQTEPICSRERVTLLGEMVRLTGEGGGFTQEAGELAVN